MAFVAIGRQAQCGVAGVAAIVVILLVATVAGVGSIVVVAVVTGYTIFCNGDVRTRKGKVLTVVKR